MDRVGRYQLLDRLGEGGMGVVYKAYDPLIQRVVAVKLIGSARTDDPVLRERFLAEARAAGHLSHRNIVTVYDLGEDAGRPYFAMEFLEGQDLGRMIRRGEPDTLLGKIDLMAQAGRGLAYAHAHGVIHRDVKPANIFVTTTGDVKVLDFGLARLVRPLGSDLSRTRPFVGTVSYMAPEQVRGEPADARTDLFAFGVVLYEMLSGGRPAFETDSLASTMHRILTEEPEPLAALDTGLPAELIRIVERALAKSRDERYQRVEQMLADLAAFRSSLNPIATAERAAGSTSLARASRARHAGAEELDLTIGHETAVDVRTPPPRPLSSGAPATPASIPLIPPAAPPAAEPLEPSGHERVGQRRWRPRVWVAAAMVAAGVAGAGVWRLAIRQAEAPTVAGTAAGFETSQSAGTTGSVPAGADQRPQRRLPDTAEGTGHASDAAGDRTAQPAGSDSASTRASAPPASQPLPAAQASPTGPRVAPRRPVAPDKEVRSRTAGAPGASASAPTGASPRPPEQTREPDRTDEASVELDEASRTLAQGALVEAARARGRAESSGAERLAPDVYAQALHAEQAAAGQFRAGDFEKARQAFAEVASLFDRAESDARAEQARQREAERGTADAALRAHPPAAGVPAIPGTAGSGAPGVSSTPGPSPVPPAREAILSLLSRYAAALEARSLTRLKQIWPNLAGAQERAIADEFQHARSIAVTLSDQQIDVQGLTATVSCRRAYRLETHDGQRLERITRTHFGLRQAAGGWAIEHVRHEQR